MQSIILKLVQKAKKGKAITSVNVGEKHFLR